MKLKTIYLTIISLLIILCTSNCATSIYNINHKSEFEFDPKQFTIIHNKIHNWQLNGKIHWHQKSGNKSTTCYMTWQKIDNKSQITFYSALNLQNVVIESYNNQNNQIKILSKNGKDYTGSKDININTETDELQKAIDSLSLNLNNLTYWLLGTPNPLKNYILINNGFKQDNWLITYSDYQQKSEHLYMPTKILIKNSNKKNITIIKIMILDFNQQ